MTAAAMPRTARHFAIFLPALSGGGAERAMVNLAAGMVARGERVDLVLGRATGPYMSSVPTDVRIIDLGTNKTLVKMRRLARYLKTNEPQGLVSGLDNINLASIAKHVARVQTRVLLSVQNHVSADLASRSSMKGRLAPLLLKWLYPRAEGVIAVSHGVADDLVRNVGLPRELISVIHNPVVNANIEQLSAEPVDHPFFKAGMPPVLMAVGRLTLQKDFPNLLRAFAVVRETRDVNLLILGQGELREALEEQVRELGIADHVSMPGFASNPYAYLAKARLFVLSSAWEGLPTVVMEALACGTAVVSTDCPSGPREILDDGAFGELCPVGDSVALAAAIERALAKPVDPRRLQDRAKIYAADRAIDQYIEALDPPSGRVGPRGATVLGTTELSGLKVSPG